MAKIVLGLGSAHSPMLSLGGDRWSEYGERDQANLMLAAVPGGEVMTYEELLSQADPAIAKALTPEKLQAQHDAYQKAIATLEKTLKDANPDVVVIVGDDQEEMFFDDNIPLFSVYWGESMRLIPRHTGESAPQIVRDSAWGYGDVEMDVPEDAELGLHLIHHLVEADFDVGHIRYQNQEYGGAVGPLEVAERRCARGDITLQKFEEIKTSLGQEDPRELEDTLQGPSRS